MIFGAFRVPKDGDEAATMMTKLTSSPAFKLGSAGVLAIYLAFVASKRSSFGQV